MRKDIEEYLAAEINYKIAQDARNLARSLVLKHVASKPIVITSGTLHLKFSKGDHNELLVEEVIFIGE